MQQTTGYIHLSLQGMGSGIVVKNQPVMWETQKMQAQSLGFEDPMRSEMATHSSILAWKIPWTEQPMGSQRVVSSWVCMHACATIYMEIWWCFLTVELSSFILLYWYKVAFFFGQHYFIYPTPVTPMLVSSDLSGLCDVANIRGQIAMKKRKM